MRWLASLVNGLNKAVTGDDHFAASKISVAGTVLPLNGVAAFWDRSAGTDVITNLAGKELSVTTGSTSSGASYFAVEALIFALHMESPEVAPLSVKVGCSQVQHRLCA